MSFQRKVPADVARSLGRRSHAYAKARGEAAASDAWRRDTFTLPRQQARDKARELFSAYPKQAYMTEIESWRELSDGQIEFTMRRLPTAD